MEGFQSLRELRERLQTLLTQLEAPDPAGANPWRATWDDCQALFERYRHSGFDPGGFDPSERDDYLRTLEDTVRLNAVVANLVARQSDAIADGMSRVADARKRLRATTEARHRPAAGGACDVRG